MSYDVLHPFSHHHPAQKGSAHQHTPATSLARRSCHRARRKRTLAPCRLVEEEVRHVEVGGAAVKFRRQVLASAQVTTDDAFSFLRDRRGRCRSSRRRTNRRSRSRSSRRTNRTSRSSGSRSRSGSRNTRPRAGARTGRGTCSSKHRQKTQQMHAQKAEHNHPARASRDESRYAPALGDLLVVEADPLVALVLHPRHVVPAVRVLALVRQDRNQLVPAPADTNNE